MESIGVVQTILGSWTSRTRWGHSAADRVERELGKIDVWVNVAFPRPPANLVS
jgi:hypothetical protein